MKQRFKIRLTSSQIILLGFFAVIIAGSLLLCCPFSSASGKSVGYIDALFTSVTSTCVTGLVTLPTVSTWSVFGQAVILVLIQVGGLGVITVVSLFMIMFNRKIGIADRLLIQDSFNLNSLSGLVKFVKKVIFGTLLTEGVGAVLYMTVFVPDFGARGIWISVFNSVSAFCNAGIDIISENSLCDYSKNITVNAVTSALIILGGIGYIVWWDIIRVLRQKGKQRKTKLFGSLSLHSKIALSSTFFLIIAGGILIFAFEFSNPDTIGKYSIPEKIQAALFQSVTTRTAGFAAIPQQNFTDASAVVSLLLMFIGGSPVGTAGGIKTVTAAVVAATALSVIRNKHSIVLFGRRISETAVRKATAVVCFSFITVFISTVLMCAVTGAAALDVIYETVSATATVGLSRGLTSDINIPAKLILCATMYFGRVGPISIAFALGGRTKNENIIKDPIEEISVG